MIQQPAFVLATQNPGKRKEFQRLLGGSSLPGPWLSLDELSIFQPLEEHGTTFVDNAWQKAAWVYARTQVPALADDSGLVVDALGGAPGVHTAHYGGMEVLLEALTEVSPAQRTARFVCVLCWYDGAAPRWFEGVCEGTIALEARGTQGFGYDPVFVPNAYEFTETAKSCQERAGATWGELPMWCKERMSHRAKACRRLRSFWASQIGFQGV